MKLGADAPPPREATPTMPRGEVWALWGQSPVRLTRLDVVGLVLFAAGAAWAVAATVLTGGSAVPLAALFLACALAFAAARLLSSRGAVVIPGTIVVMTAGLILTSPLGTWSQAPLAGPLGYANAKSALFVQAAIAAVMLAVSGRTSRLRRTGLVAAVAFATIPWVSRSFAAALPLLGLPLVGLLAARGWDRRRLIWLGAPLLVLAVLATVLLGVHGRGSARDGLLDATVGRNRIGLWSEALAMAADHPLTGVGPGRFDEESSRARRDPDLRWAHSGFLQQAAETGFVGFGILVGVFVWSFGRLAASRGEAGPALLTGFGVLLLGIHASVDYILHFPAVPVIAAALVGSACGDPILHVPKRIVRRGRIAYISTVDLTLRFLLLGEMRQLRDDGFEVTSISAPGPWVEDIERHGIRHLPWRNAVRSWNIAADVRALLELRGILRREEFDIVHTHTPKAGVLGRVAARLADIPAVVNTVHGYYATPDDRRPKQLAVLGAEWLAARCSDLELFVNEEDFRWAARVGVVPPERRVLVSGGVDLSRFDPAAVPVKRRRAVRRELGVPDDAILIGTVGRIVAEKGYRELFEAARRVRSARPDVRFVVVGSTETGKADAISDAEIETASEDVIIAGWREDVREFLAALDVFVLPSWREGLPRSGIEAAAMGLPLVLTDIRGCREIVRDGVEGLLVPPRDPERLATAIERLAGDADLRAQMGGAARVRAVERFDERDALNRIMAAYDRLLAEKGMRPPTSPPSRVRPARRDDAPSIARLHRETLPEAFLPTLGQRFLRRLYRAMAGDPEAVLLVAENGEGVVGFAAGTASVGGFYRRFRRRHAIPAALVLAPRLLRRNVRRRLRETAQYPNASLTTTEAELLSIGVAREQESAGLGTELAEEVLAGLAARGAEEVRVVVAASNRRANRFYERLGFRPVSEIAVHEGTPSNVMVIRCRS
jgi:glycosyltransferase involved in cell wall biosynthesis/ribosomal protein S18 acetylase RimI-like enzyme/O-antigen ligase